MTTILCFGDSNTWGFNPAEGSRFPRKVRWPGVMESALPKTFHVLEEGLNGRTGLLDDPFEAGRNGLPYLIPCLATHAPLDLVVLMLGTNDVKTFFPFDAAQVAAGMSRLCETILKSQAGPDGGAPKVLLVAPTPVKVPRPLTRVWGFDERSVQRSQELSAYYQAVAEKLGIGFLDAGPLVKVSPLDGVHLDKAGQAKLGRAIAKKVQELLR